MSNRRYRPKADTTYQAPRTDDQAKAQDNPKPDNSADPREQQLKRGDVARVIAETAAKVAAQHSKAEQAARASGDELGGWLKNLSDEDLKTWREYGERLKQRLEYSSSGALAREGRPLTDDEVRGYVGNGVRYLNQVVMLTSAVLDTVDAASMRKIVAGDAQSDDTRKGLKSLGYDPDKLLGPKEPASDAKDGRDHRKLPRGRRHPLVQLISLAAAAVRLTKQITRETNPHVYNRLTPSERGGGDPCRMLVTGVQKTIDRIAAR